MADWSLLPKDLLGLINGRSKTCFEHVQFRSVCSSWRSAVPRYHHSLHFNRLLLPVFNHNPRFQCDSHCRLIKISTFFLRFQTPFGADYCLVGMREKKSGNQKSFSPLEEGLRYQNGIKFNTLSSQIIPLEHYYKIKFYAITTRRYRTRRESYSKRVAFLQLDGSDFAIVAGVLGVLMMYRSRDNKWTEIEGWFKAYNDMVSFKEKFYVVDRSGRGHVFVIEPSLRVNEIPAVTESIESLWERLVVSGDELLLVQRFTPGSYGQEHMYTWFKLFRLVEEKSTKRWVRVNDLEDRVVFLGIDWNLCYSANELLGVKANCVVFIAPHNSNESFLVFDLATRKTSNVSTGYRDYMGAFCGTLESLVSCGIVTMPTPANGIFNLLSVSE